MRALLRRLLPEEVRLPLRRARRRVRVAVLRVASSSRWTASLYYGLFSGAFGREHRAVLHGRLRYEEDTVSPAGSRYLLRRNVHRLEKGLIMRPRRDVFAADYIGETVDSFASRASRGAADGEDAREMRWAGEVLGSYFAAVGAEARVDRARASFAEVAAGPAEPADDCGRPLAPYRRDLSQPPPVAYDDLLRLARLRRSVRWFLPRAVPRELVDRAVEVAALSPSACNRQPFEFRFFDHPERVRRVASIPMGTRGFEHNFPMVAVVVGRQRAYFDAKDRHVIYIDAALASMALVFALETLGLSSCCINWPDVEPQEREMEALLGLEPDERPVMLIAIGYPDPDALVPASGKKSLDSLRRYDA